MLIMLRVCSVICSGSPKVSAEKSGIRAPRVPLAAGRVGEDPWISRPPKARPSFRSAVALRIEARRKRTELCREVEPEVATSEPLDQYIVRNPDFFLGASPEHARIDPDQLLVLLDHIRCAAYELPFAAGEPFGSLTDTDEFLTYLADEGVIHREGASWHWITDAYPANAVSLRSVAEGNFLVIDQHYDGRQVIAEVDFSSAPETLY